MQLWHHHDSLPRAPAHPEEGPLMTLAPADPTRTHRLVPTRLGTYVLAAGTDGLVGVWRQDQKHFPRPARLGHAAVDDHAVLEEAEAQLLAYLAGAREDFALPLAPEGTEFQRAVWDHLRTIPRGATTTYGQIAHALGRPAPPGGRRGGRREPAVDRGALPPGGGQHRSDDRIRGRDRDENGTAAPRGRPARVDAVAR